MPRPLSLRMPHSRGPAFIGVGLIVVLVAHLYPAVPIAAAMMLIGWGATQILGAGNNRNRLLLAINLAVYAALGCFVIAAQTHSALNDPASQVSLLLWADHVAALLLLAATAKWVVGHVDMTIGLS
ncbi:MAG: hypothetical protein GXP26_00965 [Planctomycetes bacterium]|nr:hypothetical protein [Planctomycetota bacterium]